MKHISILVPNGNAVLSSVVGPYKVFDGVNSYLMNTGRSKEPFFKIQVVGIGSSAEIYNGIFTIKPDTTIHELKKTDLIIIPSFNGDVMSELKLDTPYFDWIKKQYAQGAEVASLCMGAFILASTGLLDGKRCTTHWLGADGFKQLFPKVDLVAEKIITDENGIYSSGGAYSFLNLILYLVEKYCGREVALWCTKVFEVEIGRTDQLQYTIFMGQKSHDDEIVKKAQEYIETNFKEKISVDNLANDLALSRRNFIRRFKKATANTPIEYIQRVKMEVAKKSLESSNENVNEVMYLVGYSDGKAFRNLFRKVTGLSPIKYRQKYNRLNAVI